MNEPLVVTMDALWPDMPGQRRPHEVVVTVPRSLPAVVLGCWSTTLVTAPVTVMAARPSLAGAAAGALMPELARAAGALVTVKAAA
jgi:hypothetical protein